MEQDLKNLIDLIAMTFSSRARSRQSIIDATEKILKRNLTKEEKDAIVRVVNS